MKGLAVLWFLILSIPGCVSNESEEVDILSDHKYFPLQKGKFIEYQADSIVFRQGSLLDSIRFEAREEIKDEGRDSIGRYFTILRSHRPTANEPWVPFASYTARVYQNKALKNEANVHLIKLVFPLNPGISWNGLALIRPDQVFDVEGESVEIYRDWENFKVREPAGSFTSGNLVFDDVMTVLQTDEENLVGKRYSLEKYAAGTGLVYKEMIILDCNNTVNHCASVNLPWSQRATKGFIFRQTIMRHN
jgi:hypothetical protein